MYCKHCGKENKDGQRFCKYCGADLQFTDEGSGSNRALVVVVISLAVMFMVALGIFLGLFLGHKGRPEGEDVEIANATGTTAVTDAGLENDETAEVEDKVTMDKTADNAAPEPEGNAEAAEQTDSEKLTSEENPPEYMLDIQIAEASSELDVVSSDNATYYSENLYDGNYKTAWVEGVEGNGVGQSVILKLDGVHTITRLKIYNGFLKTKRRYAINGKVTTALIDYGNGNHEMVDLNVMDVPEDEVGFEAYEMGETEIIPDGTYETDEITVTIIGAVAGSKYSDTAISEIEIYGY